MQTGAERSGGGHFNGHILTWVQHCKAVPLETGANASRSKAVWTKVSHVVGFCKHGFDTEFLVLELAKSPSKQAFSNRAFNHNAPS
jgi:hypothetical protein